MPTYSYRCPNCAHEYSKLQRITDDTRAKCPECGTRGERLISGGGGVVFRGSGFYITDYKRAGEKQGGDESKKDAGKAAKDKAKKEPGGTKSGSGESKSSKPKPGAGS